MRSALVPPANRPKQVHILQVVFALRQHVGPGVVPFRPDTADQRAMSAEYRRLDVAVQGQEERTEDVTLPAIEDVVRQAGQVVQADAAVAPPAAKVAADAPVPAGLVRRVAEVPLAAPGDVERPP